MSGDETTTGTSKTSLPPWVQAEGLAPNATYASDYLQQARNLSQSPVSLYGGQQVAGLTPQHQQAIDRISGLAQYGTPSLNAAGGAVTDIAGGRFLGQNPWLSGEHTNAVIGDTADQMQRTFSRGTAAQTDAALNRQGAFGGSGWNEQQAANAGELARATGSMANQYRLGHQGLAAQDWNTGIGQMLGASQQAPGLMASQLGAQSALAGAGDMARTVQQQTLDSQYNDWLRQMQWPYQQNQFLGTAISNAAGGSGSTTSTQTQPGQSIWGNLLGGALVGGSLWNGFTG